MSRTHKYSASYERNDAVTDGGVIQFVVKTQLELRDVSLTFVTRHSHRESSFLSRAVIWHRARLYSRRKIKK